MVEGLIVYGQGDLAYQCAPITKQKGHVVSLQRNILPQLYRHYALDRNCELLSETPMYDH